MGEASILATIVQNPIVACGFVGWLIAQSMKVALGVLVERRFDFKWFVGSGGMPSSHAALVMSVATSVGLNHGFDSGLFGVSIFFAVVTMFDAQGVRRQSGKQAEALNKILDDLSHHKGIREEPLKELFGHTPLEVLAGAIIGVVVAIVMSGP